MVVGSQHVNHLLGDTSYTDNNFSLNVNDSSLLDQEESGKVKIIIFL